jgi:hypothetical protein
VSALGKKLLLKPGMKVALVGEPAAEGCGWCRSTTPGLP